MYRIYSITYSGRKKGATFQATRLNFDLDDLKEKQGRKKFTYQGTDNNTHELFVDTDAVLEVIELPPLPGPA